MKSNKKTIAIIGAAALLCLMASVIIILARVGSSDGRRLNHQLQLGQKYLEEMDYEQAVVAFNEAIKIDPANEEAYHGLAEAYFRLGEYGNSLECLDVLLEWNGENERVLSALDDCLGEYLDVLLADEAYDDIRKLAEKYGSLAGGVDFGSALARVPIQVEVLMTDIEADSVFNTDGYGSLTIDGAGDSWDYWNPEAAAGLILPQKAVVDRNGNFLFPYISTYLTYRVSDGIVSLTDRNAYGISESYDMSENPPRYYHLDGSSAFELAIAENTYENYTIRDKVYPYVSTSNIWFGAPMSDGYTLAINQIWWWWSNGWAGGGEYEYQSYIIDRRGTTVCTLPEEFNEQIEFGDAGFVTKYGLGWCGEGLFAVFEYNLDDSWNISTEAKGYMDFSGNMAIDLSGRGFTNLFPFRGGLAAVHDEDNMTGFINKSGELVIPCIYESYSDGFSEDGLCAVQKDGKWGYIDRDNNIVIPFEYDGAYGADVGLASVIKDGKCGLVDYQNRVVADLEYDDISSPDKGVAYAIKDRKLYIIMVK